MVTALSTVANGSTALTPVAQAIADAAREEGADGLGRLMKFTKGHYTIATEEIPPNREYNAYVEHWVRGFVKFVGGHLVERRVGRVADGFVVPSRELLGDLDQSKWEKGPDGHPADPWSLQTYLPLEDCETGEIVTFVSGSDGGRRAVARLCGLAAKHLATLGQPRIKLAVENYKHKSYGRIDKPDFAIVGWTKQPEMTAAAPKAWSDDFSDSADDFSDSIPL